MAVRLILAKSMQCSPDDFERVHRTVAVELPGVEAALRDGWWLAGVELRPVPKWSELPGEVAGPDVPF